MNVVIETDNEEDRNKKRTDRNVKHGHAMESTSNQFSFFTEESSPTALFSTSVIQSLATTSFFVSTNSSSRFGSKMEKRKRSRSIALLCAFSALFNLSFRGDTKSSSGMLGVNGAFVHTPSHFSPLFREVHECQGRSSSVHSHSSDERSDLRRRGTQHRRHRAQVLTQTPRETKKTRGNNNRRIGGAAHEDLLPFALRQRVYREKCRKGDVGEAYLLLKCLVSGKGTSEESKRLSNRDFHFFLSACTSPSNVSQRSMKMARYVFVLQRRLQEQQLIYRDNNDNIDHVNCYGLSMLLRGYGRLNDEAMVKQCSKLIDVRQELAADMTGNESVDNFVFPKWLSSVRIEPDVILCNTLLDAFVRCRLMQEAKHLLQEMLLGDEEDSANQSFALSFLGGLSEETAAAVSVVSSESRGGLKCREKRVKRSTLPKPNQRTYNIFLKGLAGVDKNKFCRGNAVSACDAASTWESIQTFSAHLLRINMWDAVTTNTMINACVSHRKFDVAEKLLKVHTVRFDDDGERVLPVHPNVEAYTELLDGYAKMNKFEKARKTFDIMRERHVLPNEHTLTALLNALAREGNVTLINDALQNVHRECGQLEPDDCDGRKNEDRKIRKLGGVRIMADVYNAVFTGLLLDPYEKGGETVASRRNKLKSGQGERSSSYGLAYNKRVQYGMLLFSEMIRAHSCEHENRNYEWSSVRSGMPRPNVVCATIILQGLARICCTLSHPRMTIQQERRSNIVKSAQKLFDQLVQLGFVPRGNAKTTIPLIQMYASIDELDTVKQLFDSVEPKDTVVLNAYLDANSKIGTVEGVLKGFRQNVGFANDTNGRDVMSKFEMNLPHDKSWLTPDVITYTVLITTMLQSVKFEERDPSYESRTTNGKVLPHPVNDSTILPRRVQLLYKDMRTRWNILPDRAMVDSILQNVCNTDENKVSPRKSNPRRRIAKASIASFLKQLLVDAKRYECYGEDMREYDARVRMVKAFLAQDRKGRKDRVDDLFERKGWNTVDSSFRILGGTGVDERNDEVNLPATKRKERTGDEWLESKGWNDVESGFRIL